MNATSTTPDVYEVCRRILAALDHLTPEQFARGGDRPIRDALAVVLAEHDSGPARTWEKF